MLTSNQTFILLCLFFSISSVAKQQCLDFFGSRERAGNIYYVNQSRFALSNDVTTRYSIHDSSVSFEYDPSSQFVEPILAISDQPYTKTSSSFNLEGLTPAQVSSLKLYRLGVRGQTLAFANIAVTGDKEYTLRQVFYDLRLGDKEILAMRTHGKTVLSLGEGTSSLVPGLRAQGIAAYGIDLAYVAQKPFSLDYYTQAERRAFSTLFQFKDKNAPFLIAGSALSLPFADQSFDVILSHLLFNNLGSSEARGTALAEAYRVLKIGGELRIFGFPQLDVEKVLRQTLPQVPQNEINIEFAKVMIVDSSGDIKQLSVSLVVLTKKH